METHRKYSIAILSKMITFRIHLFHLRQSTLSQLRYYYCKSEKKAR